MPNEIIPNSFTSYKLTDEEVLQGSVYNDLQTKVLQNLLSTYAEEKLALDYDPEHKEQFLQNEAILKGSIELIQFLLQTSVTSQEFLIKLHTGDEI